MQLDRLPIPPTSNRFLLPINGRLIKSTEARRYEQEMRIYKLKNTHKLIQLQKLLKPPLKVDCFFIFHKPRLLSKKNTMKMLDASNRLKIAHDEIAKLIEIDDCQFVTGVFEKIACEHEKDQQLIVRFTNVVLRDYTDFTGGADVPIHQVKTTL